MSDKRLPYFGDHLSRLGGGWGCDLTSGCDNVTQTCLNCPQMNCDGRHVLCKWLQLAWTELANCCHLDRSLVVQLEKRGLRTRALQRYRLWMCVCVCLFLHVRVCVHAHRSQFSQFENVGPQLVAYINFDLNSTIKPARSPWVCLLPRLLWWCQLAWEHTQVSVRHCHCVAL